jgi:uncharacterized protein YjiS (DUF1127 family)
MLDLDQLEVEREKAATDKADLFDFYHNNWRSMMDELRDFRQLLDDLKDAGITNRFSDR